MDDDDDDLGLVACLLYRRDAKLILSTLSARQFCRQQSQCNWHGRRDNTVLCGVASSSANCASVQCIRINLPFGAVSVIKIADGITVQTSFEIFRFLQEHTELYMPAVSFSLELS